MDQLLEEVVEEHASLQLLVSIYEKNTTEYTKLGLMSIPETANGIDCLTIGLYTGTVGGGGGIGVVVSSTGGGGGAGV